MNRETRKLRIDGPIVVDLVPAEPRVFPVGRLDAETEGDRDEIKGPAL